MSTTNPDGRPIGSIGSARDVRAITPHATDALSPVPDGIMVNVAGNVALRGVDGNDDVTLTLLAGVVYPIRAKYVRVSGTTATGIFGLYN